MATKLKAGGDGPAGTTTRPTPHGTQVVDSLGCRWTDEAEVRFLDELGASANIKRAVLASGFCTSTVYRRRRADAAFAERWRVALTQGFDRLEMLLLQRATEALEGRAPDPEYPIPSMTIAEIIRILQLHRAEVRGAGAKRPGQGTRVRSLDEMRRSILAKLDAIETARCAEGDE